MPESTYLSDIFATPAPGVSQPDWESFTRDDPKMTWYGTFASGAMERAFLWRRCRDNALFVTVVFAMAAVIFNVSAIVLRDASVEQLTVCIGVTLFAFFAWTFAILAPWIAQRRGGRWWFVADVLAPIVVDVVAFLPPLFLETPLMIKHSIADRSATSVNSVFRMRPVFFLTSTIFVRPRFFLAVIPAAVHYFTLILLTLFVYRPPPVETLSVGIVVLGLHSCVLLVVYSTDRQNRDWFRSIASAHHARITVARFQNSIDAITAAAAPPHAARKLQTRNFDDIFSSSQATDGAVGVVAVADFAQWSTGLLPIHTIIILHRLFGELDSGSSKFSVSKAATYADLYIVVSTDGLGECADVTGRDSIENSRHQPSHSETVTAFGYWAVTECVDGVLAALRKSMVGSFALRAAVGSGEFSFGLAGTEEVMRPVVTGEALNMALEMLLAAGPRQVAGGIPAPRSASSTPLNDGGNIRDSVRDNFRVDLSANQCVSTHSTAGSHPHNPLRDSGLNRFCPPMGISLRCSNEEAHDGKHDAQLEQSASLPEHPNESDETARNVEKFDATDRMIAARAATWILNPCTLSFSNPEVESAAIEHALATIDDWTLLGGACLGPAGLFICIVISIVIEFAWEGDAYVYDGVVVQRPLQPGMKEIILCVLLCFVPTLFVLRAVFFRLASKKIWSTGDSTIAFAAMLVGVCCGSFLQEALAFRSTMYMAFVYAAMSITMWPNKWIINGIVHVFIVLLLGVASHFRQSSATIDQPIWILSAISFTIATSYLARRALRYRFLVSALMEALAIAATERSELRKRCVCALLPSHIAPQAFSTLSRSVVQRSGVVSVQTRAKHEPMALVFWHSLIVCSFRVSLTDALHASGLSNFAAMAGVWRRAVEVIDGLRAEVLDIDRRSCRDAECNDVGYKQSQVDLELAASDSATKGIHMLGFFGDEGTVAGPFTNDKSDRDIVPAAIIALRFATSFPAALAVGVPGVSHASGRTALNRSAGGSEFPSQPMGSSITQKVNAVRVTMVLSAGGAHSALFGSELFAYRLLGPAVREVSSLLRAAPEPNDLISPQEYEEVSVAAFTTSSFRRVYRGCLSAFAAKLDVRNLAMSLRIPPSQSTSAKSARLPMEQDVDEGGDDVFLPPLRWRVRGVGVLMVSAVRRERFLRVGPGVGEPPSASPGGKSIDAASQCGDAASTVDQ